MLARYITAFLWGAALANVWWLAATFGYGDNAVLWLLPVVGTLVSLLGFIVVFVTHWD
jgi:hypothetical protein